MLPAFLTAVCFAFSAIFAGRSSRLVGGTAANLSRTLIALALLALWAHGFGKGMGGPSLKWFLVSGVIGFGLGDTALFFALPRIGPRLSIMLVQCLAAPFGVLAEWLWLGTKLRPAQLACGAVILIGVAIALAPSRHVDVHRRSFFTGTIFGVIAALGQALGAVISRKGSFVAEAAGMWIDGGTVAYQRLLGGIAFTALVFFFAHRGRFTRSVSNIASARWPIILNALAGPALGVGCYQWALATAPTGVVLPIVALTPVLAIPLAWLLDGDRPGARSIVGGVLAVAGTIALSRS